MATDFNLKTQETTRQLNRSTGSFELAFAPVILGLLGLWLDRTVDTTPLFLILFSVVGFAGTGVKLYYAYNHEMSQHEENVPWLGHESSSEFRKHGTERLERNSGVSHEAVEDTAARS
ncbi:MAG TPA: AtpZ/AtpI family protein [Microthrixaceae bacterium]|nr:AtpZ/AtpI family protein [Microthrixaceae bacterium]